MNYILQKLSENPADREYTLLDVTLQIANITAFNTLTNSFNAYSI
jgi:hypothetical protein